MIAGEEGGSKYFSHLLINKDDWQAIDHAAYLLWCLREVHVKSNAGVFNGLDRSLGDSVINERLWRLVKEAEYELAPSRVNRGK